MERASAVTCIGNHRYRNQDQTRFSDMSRFLPIFFALAGILPGATPAEEARTPVFWSTVISKPGSYYLAQDITGHGITVAASDVTLDLNGFRMHGDNEGAHGVLVHSPDLKPLSNIEVRNGTISGFLGNGVHAASEHNGLRLIDLRVLDNGSGGAASDGSGAGVLVQGEMTLVRNCAILDNAGYGALLGRYALVKDSEFNGNGLTGLVTDVGALVNGNRFTGNGHNGLAMGRLSLAHANQMRHNGGAGLFAYAEVIVENNQVNENYATGAVLQEGNVVINNQFVANRRNGLEHKGASVLIGNQASRNGEYGIDMGGSSVLEDNIASANSVDGGFRPDIEPCGSCAIGSNVSARD
jgi:hypothetical protein